MHYHKKIASKGGKWKCQYPASDNRLLCAVVQTKEWNVRQIQPINAHDPFHWRMVLEKAHILTWYLYGSSSV